MVSSELPKIVDELIKKGKMEFNEAATEEQIADLEKRKGFRLPEKYKEWLCFSNGGRLFIPFGVSLFGVDPYELDLLIEFDEERPDESFALIGSLFTGCTVLYKKGEEKIYVYNYEKNIIIENGIYDDFCSFLKGLCDLLGEWRITLSQMIAGRIDIDKNLVSVIDGVKKISITIRPSWPEHSEPSVQFDFYKKDLSWKVYWDLFSMKDHMIQKIAKAIAELQDIHEVLDDPGFGVLISEDQFVCFHTVNTEIGDILNKVCQNGLQCCEKNCGLDGVSYEIKIEGFPVVYEFWRRLPTPWAAMKTVIDMCVDYARIDRRVYKCGVDRRGTFPTDTAD